MAKNYHLSVWVGEQGELSLDARAPSPRPTPQEALYERPNPSGTRKLCANCALYVRGDSTCSVHDPAELVSEGGCCARHLCGVPREERAELQDASYPSLDCSRYSLSSTGRSCDTCRYYESIGPLDGECSVLEEAGCHALVEALGCCSRFAP